MAIYKRANQRKVSIGQQQKQDALALAELIFDLYQKQRASAKITNGQNDAQTKTS